MGLELLKKTEAFLKEHKTEAYTKTTLRNELHMNYDTLINILAYLHLEKKIKIIDGKNEKYQWGGRK